MLLATGSTWLRITMRLRPSGTSAALVTVEIHQPLRGLLLPVAAPLLEILPREFLEDQAVRSRNNAAASSTT